MTNTVLSSDDDLITEAGIEGVGPRTAERLEAVGITSVTQLAEADTARLADRLGPTFPKLRAETLRQRVNHWVALAKERVSRSTNRATRGHVFLLTLWADSDGRPLRSRFGYRSPDEPTSEATSLETVGWSPLAFARFVEQAAGLSRARGLTEERVESTEVVEWSKHRIQGPLVRGGWSDTEIRTDVPTDQFGSEGSSIRWRASGRLVPLGGGQHVALGTTNGVVDRGDVIDLAFAVHLVPAGVHRAWFDLAVSPPEAPDQVPGAAAGMTQRAS